MMIVTGSVRARPETAEEVLALCLQHVELSRLESGCLLHSVHRDVEDPHRLVFLEHWTDGPSLAAHFALPAPIELVTRVSELASEPPVMDAFEATRLDPAALA
ncbi:MAG TPA: putative quinol monooxygenase [Euzebya sp.]|nr:putative quinol monooxygenase [Euzebya sp.]